MESSCEFAELKMDLVASSSSCSGKIVNVQDAKLSPEDKRRYFGSHTTWLSYAQAYYIQLGL